MSETLPMERHLGKWHRTMRHMRNTQCDRQLAVIFMRGRESQRRHRRNESRFLRVASHMRRKNAPYGDTAFRRTASRDAAETAASCAIVADIWRLLPKTTQQTLGFSRNRITLFNVSTVPEGLTGEVDKYRGRRWQLKNRLAVQAETAHGGAGLRWVHHVVAKIMAETKVKECFRGR